MEDKYTKYKGKPEYNECEDDFCDLNPDKICDNCGECIKPDKNYKIIKITKIINDTESD